MTISTTKKLLGAAVAASVVFALAGCGQAPTDKPGGSGDPAASDFTPCIVSDAGGFDDKSFNQLSYEGAQKAADELGATLKKAESNAETEYGPNIDNMVSEGCNAIVSVGFALSQATVDAATANPDTDFILVDDAGGDSKPDNVKPLLYDTAQAAFLAGYLSAGYTKTAKVGTYGGMEFPTVTIFMDGFKQGVDYYNTENGTAVEVVGWDGTTGSFTGGFEANQDAKTTAQNIIDQGVDVLFPVGGPIYQSGLQAIKDSGKDIALIGADADLFNTDPTTADFVLTSVLKAMDLSTYEAVMASADDSFSGDAYIGTLDNEGVGIAPLHNFESKVDAELVKKVDAIKQEIIDGKITVTSYLSE
ncbi:MAG: BMP family ABC transporter substrate-binding protein [Microbacterium sp.]|uniref:Basic membrane protein A n=1 Tax=Microbacterium natoriense TaxID=284570 RepID=A0AAW8F340_9MICO|nr:MULTISPECIES: BMP family ABC transporter substrate-binding protein [Microbacterium]MBW8763565.1 BMP family ABC transporter substrate-binding protein [Microbacterium sp.]MDQ0648977.1 basic membrane protein A [Microbacterium natoriense]